MKTLDENCLGRIAEYREKGKSWAYIAKKFHSAGFTSFRGKKLTGGGIRLWFGQKSKGRKIVPTKDMSLIKISETFIAPKDFRAGEFVVLGGNSDTKDITEPMMNYIWNTLTTDQKKSVITEVVNR